MGLHNTIYFSKLHRQQLPIDNFFRTLFGSSGSRDVVASVSDRCTDNVGSIPGLGNKMYILIFRLSPYGNKRQISMNILSEINLFDYPFGTGIKQ